MNEGFDAYYDAVPVTACPYEQNTKKALRWLKGWYLAEKQYMYQFIEEGVAF